MNFEEQAQRALQVDPEFVFITGWNEWVAGRFAEFAGVKRPVMFVDEFNQEFSRDIEPMDGGHQDNYYYQLVSFIRKYKGVHRPAWTGRPKKIDLNGDFSQWRSIQPSYRDDIGDATHRDHVGWSSNLRYVNNTGRNDFVEMKVSYDEKNLYFYARTKDVITPYTDRGWMNLFVSLGNSKGPSWLGYHYAINRLPADANKFVIERSLGGWNWESIAEVPYRVSGNELHLAIPLEQLGLSKVTTETRMEFKWADNLQTEGEPSDFDLNGDVAPNGRFNYGYVMKPGAH
jgi:hypothetical protein